MRSSISIAQFVFRLFSSIVFAAACAATVQAQSEPIVMKIGTGTVNDGQNQWMKEFAALVEKGSGGRIKVALYPASQLGNTSRMIEGTQFGSIQAFVGPPDFLSGIDSRFEILSSPGLFKDAAHLNRTIMDPEFNAAFLALGSNKGLKGIGIFLNGPEVIATRTPVRKLSDFKGMKIRVMSSAVLREEMRRLKATAVPMALGEVVAALQQGTLDGVMSSMVVLTPMHFYDASKYIYELNHAIGTTITVVGKSWYDKLPPDLQKVITDSGQRASKDVYQWEVDFINAQSERWLKAGGEITQPTAAERVQIMEMMRPIGAELAAKKPEEKALYDLLIKVAKRNE
jgi:TRAP-type C4-dicarboxylate transport system substrate-binding protein